jgi:hypothetical protein
MELLFKNFHSGGDDLFGAERALVKIECADIYE